MLDISDESVHVYLLACDGPACLYRLVSARAPRRYVVRRVGMVLTEVMVFWPTRSSSNTVVLLLCALARLHQ
jgi:hypothetical protein